MSKLDFKQKVLVIFFLSLPFVDLLTSLSTRFIDSPITIGIVVKGLSLLVSLVYVLKFSKCQYRKHTIGYLLLICAFAILYFLTKPDVWTLSSLLTEVISAFKFLYFPIMMLCLYNVFHDFDIEIDTMKRIISIDCLVYALLIIVPYITGTDFPSYNWAFSGTTGWFYAANEIGAILVMLSVCILYFMDNNNKKKILLAIPIIYAISLMGTKVCFIGIIAMVVVASIIYILRTKKDPYLLPGILLLMLLIASLNSATIKNMNTLSGLITVPPSSTETEESTEVEIVPETTAIANMEEEPNTEITDSDKNVMIVLEEDVEMSNYIQSNKILSLINRITSKRLLYLMQNFPFFTGNGPLTLLFGLGWAPRTAINYTYYRPLIEIDIFDILLHYGILGFCVYFTPFIYLAYKLFRYIKHVPLEAWAHIFSVVLSFGISCVAGHVMGAPSVSIFMILLIILVVRQTRANIKKS